MAINWPDLTFPPINLWNAPKQERQMQTLQEIIVADAQRRLSELEDFYDNHFGDQLWTWHDVNDVSPGDWDLFCELNEIIEGETDA